MTIKIGVKSLTTGCSPTKLLLSPWNYSPIKIIIYLQLFISKALMLKKTHQRHVYHLSCFLEITKCKVLCPKVGKVRALQSTDTV